MYDGAIIQTKTQRQSWNEESKENAITAIDIATGAMPRLWVIRTQVQSSQDSLAR